MMKALKTAVVMALGAFLLGPAVADARQIVRQERERTMLERIEDLELGAAILRSDLAEEKWRSAALANMVELNRAVLRDLLLRAFGDEIADDFTASHLRQMLLLCVSLPTAEERRLLSDGNTKMCDIAAPLPDA